MADNKIIDEMNAYYASCAPWHDEYMGYTCNEKMEDLLSPIIGWCVDYIRDRDVLEIACGTGNWTQVLSKRARSVLATDINTSVIDIARTKQYARGNVTFQIVDAYDLTAVDGGYDAAFAADWWSHIPKSAIPGFVRSVTGKLKPGSLVVMLDMLHREIFDQFFSHYDDEGNRIGRRQLPNGEVFHVVKNFPTEEELRQLLSGLVDDVDYREHDALRRWLLTFRTRWHDR
jgi:demethylmenaquinone methyltransferase/2-methoxy-6-polyprenyl-1,4-benzoquinol methylase